MSVIELKVSRSNADGDDDVDDDDDATDDDDDDSLNFPAAAATRTTIVAHNKDFCRERESKNGNATFQ